MIPTTTRRWSLVAAHTNGKLIDIDANHRIVIVYAKVTLGNSATGDMSIEVGVGAAGLPTVVDDDLTGGVGVFLSSAGIAKGGGVVESNGGSPLCVGVAGDDLYVTHSLVVGSMGRLIVEYWIDDLTPPA